MTTWPSRRQRLAPTPVGALLAALLTAVAIPLALSAEWGSPEELRAAINDGFHFERTTWDGVIVNNTHPMIWAQKILWSAKPRPLNFTVVTQLSVDRLPALYAQCTSFSGTVAAAIYLPLVQGGTDQQLSPENLQHVAHAEELLAETFAMSEQGGSALCQLDLMLLWEVYDSLESKVLYPIDYMRNYAHLQVRTRLLLQTDVDMYISRTLSDELLNPASLARQERLCGERVLSILPAFETADSGDKGRKIAKELFMASKADLARAAAAKQVVQFQLHYWVGHHNTDYKRWFKASTPYEVAYVRGYEPWFMTCWETMPLYNVLYRGYGGDKLETGAAMHFYGFKFQVHPNAWIIHNPHALSAGKKKQNAENYAKQKHKLANNSMVNRYMRLMDESIAAVENGTYKPITDPRMTRVFDLVPWLQRPAKMQGTARKVPPRPLKKPRSGG